MLHDLDPHAIIRVPDMVYQPPLIGSRVLLNFTAHSWPATGGILAGLAFASGVAALLLAYRRPALRDVRNDVRNDARDDVRDDVRVSTAAMQVAR